MSALDEPLLETARSTWPTTHHFQSRCAKRTLVFCDSERR